MKRIIIAVIAIMCSGSAFAAQKPQLKGSLPGLFTKSDQQFTAEQYYEITPGKSVGIFSLGMSEKDVYKIAAEYYGEGSVEQTDVYFPEDETQTPEKGLNVYLRGNSKPALLLLLDTGNSTTSTVRSITVYNESYAVKGSDIRVGSPFSLVEKNFKVRIDSYAGKWFATSDNGVNFDFTSADMAPDGTLTIPSNEPVSLIMVWSVNK